MPADVADEHDRLERERAFHDERFAVDGGERRSSRFYTVTGDARAHYQSRLDDLAPGSVAVEYGCGTGSAAFGLAARGVHVTGIDISPVAIRAAQERADAEGLTTATFTTMNAEALDLPDGSVDLVCGTGILHHLDLDTAYGELARVLRPTGRGVFLEPLGHNPVINLYRRLTPGERTEDEHPLLTADLGRAHRWFEVVDARGFDLLALGALVLNGRPGFDPAVRTLQSADHALFRAVPRSQALAWTVVLELARPRHAVIDG